VSEIIYVFGVLLRFPLYVVGMIIATVILVPLLKSGEFSFLFSRS
jgi:hypothetical protein